MIMIQSRRPMVEINLLVLGIDSNRHFHNSTKFEIIPLYKRKVITDDYRIRYGNFGTETTHSLNK